MADKTDLERAVDEMISDLDKAASHAIKLEQEYTGLVLNLDPDDQEDIEALREDVQHWRSEYWAIKDEYDQLVDQIETLVRKYCNG